MSTQQSYWSALRESAVSLATGLRLTFRHLRNARKSRKPLGIADREYFNEPDGIQTVQYPHVMIPIPDNGRYRLHNEIDDCIVCDKCAKICPVNCITIEPIKAVEEIGKTSDGTSKRIYAAKFDIDMGKCCFCGLCTTVCPTECLTMTKVFDFSTFDMQEHVHAFAEMTPADIESKRKLLEEKQRAKAEGPTAESAKPTGGEAAKAKPVFKPRIKPGGSSSS